MVHRIGVRTCRRLLCGDVVRRNGILFGGIVLVGVDILRLRLLYVVAGGVWITSITWNSIR